MRIPNAWLLDKDTTAAVKGAVLSLRKKREYGPRNRERIVFRASELGDIAGVRDSKGGPVGCQLRVFHDFWPERYPRRPMDAETALNFERGDESEDKTAARLAEAGILTEAQVMLGAWVPCRDPAVCAAAWDAKKPLCGLAPYLHADPRFPDRSRGLVRGKADFVLNHPTFGRVPLEWKSASRYVFGSIPRDGAKPENSLQAHWYGYEMGTEYVALGYEDKESGDFVILYAKTDRATIEAVLARAEVLRDQHVRPGVPPPRPEGARPPTYNDNRFWGKVRAPPEPYFDKVFPCYSYGSQKRRVNACAFFEWCWGVLPAKPDEKPARKNPIRSRRKTAKGDVDTASFSFEG